MEAAMKNLALLLLIPAALGLQAACSKNETSAVTTSKLFAETAGSSAGAEGRKGPSVPDPAETSPAGKQANLSGIDPSATLEEIAEIERSGNFTPGLGASESALREAAGDFSGALIAAYKELSWLYGYGGVEKTGVEEGIQKALSYFESEDIDTGDFRGAASSARGVLAFIRGQWEEAAELLNNAGKEDESPDSFVQWMKLVCDLERGIGSPEAYGAIRARFTGFPEYWYRGARANHKRKNIAASYAEQCINLSSDGPFSGECRVIVARALGLDDSGDAIRSKAEIVKAVQMSVSEKDPKILAGLFPMLDLPDNAYTHYALGAMKPLSALPGFREYFDEKATASKGRLAERLAYITRG
jgi:hypothetical protein